MAEAGKQLQAAHMQQAAQQQAQQQAQDPLFQLQQQELQIKAQEVQRKAQKDQADQALAEKKLQLEFAKAAGSVEGEEKRTTEMGRQADDRVKLEMLKAALAAEAKKKEPKPAPKPKPKSKE